MKRRSNILAIVLVVLHLAGLGVFLALRPPSSMPIPPDRRVDWVMPPGQFQHKCGRVCFDTEPGNRGGFKDFNGRVLHFAGAVLDVDIDWMDVPADFPFHEFKAGGYSVIRVPVRWSDLEPEPMTVSADTMIVIRTFLDRAAAAGVAVILQNHTPFSDTVPYPSAPIAPKWAFRGPAERFFTDFLMANWTPDEIALQDHLIRSWIKLAEVASRSAGLLGYGLVSSTPCPDGTEAECRVAWQGFLDRFVNGVLAVADTSVFFIGSEGMGGIMGHATDREGDRASSHDDRHLAILTELVPSNADDYPAPFLADVNGVFGFRHVPITTHADLVTNLSAIEVRGRSFLVTIIDKHDAAGFAYEGIDPFSRIMARPRPEQISGVAPSWSFDRMKLPDRPGLFAGGPGTTDVFSLEFETLSLRQGLRSETTIRLPVAVMYGERDRDGSPAFTVDVSDGTVEWLPGKSDTIVWRTDDAARRHSMKIVPWGGRRLDFITDLTDIPPR